MAVAPLLAFIGSASADNGGSNLFSYIHEHADGIDQCQNGEDFRNEIYRVMRILLQTVKNAGSQDVDTEFSRSNGRSEVGDLLPVMVCDREGDGGHRCPYFPCPYCHRSRKIFVPESKTALITCAEDDLVRQETLLAIGADDANDRDILPNRSVNDDNVLACDGEGDGGHRCPYFPCPYCHRSRKIFVPESKTALMTCAEDDLVRQETLFAIGADDANDRDILPNRSVNDDNVLACDGEGDGGHRCPYFPCPYCHRSRSIFVPKADSMNEDWQSISHSYVDFYPLKRTDDIQNSVPVLECPDKGHTCPYFPCPICHRDR